MHVVVFDQYLVVTSLHRLRDTVCLPRVHLLACLFDLLQNGLISYAWLGDDGGGLRFEGYIEGLDTCRVVQHRFSLSCHIPHTVKLLQHALDRAGATAAGHGDVEFVVVIRHDCRRGSSQVCVMD